MAEFDIVENRGYIVANDEDDLMAFLQSSKFSEIMDRHPNLPTEIIFRDEVN